MFDAPTVILSDENQYVLEPWAGLTSSLQALHLTVHDACSSCLLIGAIVTQAAYGCVGGDPSACSSLIMTYQLFQSVCSPGPCT